SAHPIGKLPGGEFRSKLRHSIDQLLRPGKRWMRSLLSRSPTAPSRPNTARPWLKKSETSHLPKYLRERTSTENKEIFYTHLFLLTLT
ncbi:hypothetical protein P4050_27955, partial [Pseudomonas aeruginosa]|nr:hypothetical protein [Pseudomonas aeruginosa]